MNPPITSTFEPDVLLIFVGFSSDGDAAANAIVALESELQRELTKLKKFTPAIPFNHVKLWKWDNDAHAAVGGQAVVVTPELERANIAVFVFKERIGRVTWEELDFARKRTPPIPVLLFFPSKPPPDDLMMDHVAAEHWTDLLKKKRELGSGWTEPDSKAVTPLPTYADPDQLRKVAGERLTTTLVNLVKAYAITPSPLPPSQPALPKSWSPAVLYPLQPAPHFAGREKLLKDLSAWAIVPNDPNRVVALVAAGGTGKTALAERVMASLANYSAAGVFVWSFYENPQTEAFLRAACEYFFGEAPKETGGLLERLQQGLRADNLPHLLILDGLELVQALGTTGRHRGTLEDPSMKRFLRWVAAGQGTRTKALITSRFGLPELEDWRDHGFRSLELHDLDPTAAKFVLRKRGVKGDDSTLEKLVSSVHRHALTVDVLGLYLHRFGNDDPRNAAKFDLKSFSNKQKGERLSKVLTSYAANLPNDERDLLARLSLFPRGISIEYLGFVINAGGEIAGALNGCDHIHLLDMLEGLRELGLVFMAMTRDGPTYSAHPFLRDFFRALLGATKPEQVHEVVRHNLASNLELQPGGYPIDSADLDRYERLIEFTCMASQTRHAYTLYIYFLGGYNHLGISLGEHIRGFRILSLFVEKLQNAELSTKSDVPRRALLTDWGRFALCIGDIESSVAAFNVMHDDLAGDITYHRLPMSIMIRLFIEYLSGHWPLLDKLATHFLGIINHNTDSSSRAHSSQIQIYRRWMDVAAFHMSGLQGNTLDFNIKEERALGRGIFILNERVRSL